MLFGIRHVCLGPFSRKLIKTDITKKPCCKVHLHTSISLAKAWGQCECILKTQSGILLSLTVG